MSKPNEAAGQRRDTVMLPTLYREAAIVSGSYDQEQRTFDIVWTAGAAVQRVDWWTGQRYFEVLEVADKSVRLERLNSGRAPVLNAHSRWSLESVMGVVEKESVRLVKGEGYAKVRLSKREDIAPIVSDIRDGIIVNVSPGYITHRYREEYRDGALYRVAEDWEPMEISFVPVGADPDASLRSAHQGATFPCVIVRAQPEEAAAARMRMRQAGLKV